MSKFRYANLTAGLLARKGEAEPVASPFADQLLTRVGAPAVEVNLQPMRKAHGHGHGLNHSHGHGHPSAGQGTGAGAVESGGLASTFGRRQAEPTIPPDYPSLFTDPIDPPPVPKALEAPRPAAAVRPAEVVRPVFRPVGPPAVIVSTPEVEPANTEPALGQACGNCPSPEEAGKVYHINLRLKRARFVRLKLSAALLRRPVQEIVAEALDRWFDTLPADVAGECACLKARGD